MSKDTTCHACKKPGHFARDCLKNTQVKQTVPGSTENNQNQQKSQNLPKYKYDKRNTAPKFKSNSTPKKPGSKYYCIVCKTTSHSTSYCRVVKEAKRILNRQSGSLRTYFSELSADPHSPELAPLQTELVSVIEEFGENLDPCDTVEALYNLPYFWNHEEGELSEEENPEDET